MQILDALFNPQIDRFSRALSATTYRQGLLTSNLANVNTPGYKRRDADFNIALDSASDRLKGFGTAADGGSLRLDGNNVDLEREVSAIAETELRYQALTEMTTRYFAGLKSVIKEGR